MGFSPSNYAEAARENVGLGESYESKIRHDKGFQLQQMHGNWRLGRQTGCGRAQKTHVTQRVCLRYELLAADGARQNWQALTSAAHRPAGTREALPGSMLAQFNSGDLQSLRSALLRNEHGIPSLAVRIKPRPYKETLIRRAASA
jgi:hypothetical protein